jgi:hypothetical protein
MLIRHLQVMYVRNSLDLSEMIGQLMTKLREVKHVAGLDAGIGERIDSFNFLAEKVGRIKSWWDAKVESNITPVETPLPIQTPDLDLPMDFLDDWFPELLTPWDNDSTPYADAYSRRIQ